MKRGSISSITGLLLLISLFTMNNVISVPARERTPQRITPTRTVPADAESQGTFDLSIVRITVVRSDGKVDESGRPLVKPGVPFTVRFLVSNAGPGPSAPATAALSFRCGNESLFSSSMSIAGLASGARQTYDMAVTLAKPSAAGGPSRTSILMVSVSPEKQRGFTERTTGNNALRISCSLEAETGTAGTSKPPGETSAGRPVRVPAGRGEFRPVSEPSVKFQVKGLSLGSTEKWVEEITITSPETVTFRLVPQNVHAEKVRWELSLSPFDKTEGLIDSRWLNTPESGSVTQFAIDMSKYMPKSPGMKTARYYARIVFAAKGQQEKQGSSNPVTINCERLSDETQKFDIPDKDLTPPPAHRRWKADFNGDRKDDIIAFNRENGDVYVSLSSGKGFLKKGDRWLEGFCHCTGIPAVGDFNGDGKTDCINFVRGDKDSTINAGDVFVALSNGSSFAAPRKWIDSFCAEKENLWAGFRIPAVGDFNGDGKYDIAYFIKNTEYGNRQGDVYVALSTGSAFSAPVKWHDSLCLNEEIPLVGDFDGDGKDDIASFVLDTKHGDPSVGDVYVALSTGTGFSEKVEKWHDLFCCEKYEVPLVGDFNMDGKDDIASVTTGAGGKGKVVVALSKGKQGRSFGVSQKWHDYLCAFGELLAAGDFDGDSIDDIAIFSNNALGGDKRGNVNVARSTGVEFLKKMKWHDWFCINCEIPAQFAALHPSRAFLKNGEVLIKNLACKITEDKNSDQCSLRVYADGILVHDLKKELKAGDTWTQNRKIPFYRNVKIELWDRDASPDKDDHLGTVLVDLSSAAGNKTGKMTHDDADYSLVYSLTNLADDDKKLKALAALMEFNYSKNSEKFSKINKYNNLIGEIKARIKNPTVMYQADQSLCGPVAIIVALALKNPERYVHMCREMYEKGTFSAYGETIKPGSHLYTAPVPQGMPHVDWMLAASMRDYENEILDFDEDDKVAGMTGPQAMTHWMKSILGCANPAYVSTYTSGEKSALKEAGDAINNGCVAAVMVDHCFLPNAKKASEVNHPTHWVLLLDVEAVGSIVKFDIFTWGKVMHVELGTDAFEDLFWGVVFGYY
ncbi:MAG: FG-GAP-like repeat-containing protein [Candidatus Xenobiia bacterium LiM19]